MYLPQDMLFYMSCSSAELPCGAFELVLHRNMEKVRDGKKVHRRLSAQPYVVVKSSHGHFLVGCRGTDCFPDMVQVRASICMLKWKVFLLWNYP
jgi:hypothetical protein